MFFPQKMDASKAEVVIWLNPVLCMESDLPIFKIPNGGFYMDQPSAFVVTPDLFLKVVDASTSLPLYPEGPGPSSSGGIDLSIPPPNCRQGFISSIPSHLSCAEKGSRAAGMVQPSLAQRVRRVTRVSTLSHPAAIKGRVPLPLSQVEMAALHQQRPATMNCLPPFPLSMF